MTRHVAAKAASAEGGLLEQQSPQAGLSLLFAVGERPSAQGIRRLLESGSFPGHGVRITHRPEGTAGWLELLASGLTFDLAGLAPAPGTAVPDPRHVFGISREAAAAPREAITLLPGPHLAGGAAMIPVVRTMAGLAASLAACLPVTAVCWHPAVSWMEPAYFARVIGNWLSGGAFPALGLTALAPAAQGGVESVGLSFFTGQEVRVEALAGEAPADLAKLAVRAIDYCVKQGPLRARQELQGPAGEPLLAEPSPDGRLVEIWRHG